MALEERPVMVPRPWAGKKRVALLKAMVPGGAGESDADGAAVLEEEAMAMWKPRASKKAKGKSRVAEDLNQNGYGETAVTGTYGRGRLTMHTHACVEWTQHDGRGRPTQCTRKYVWNAHGCGGDDATNVCVQRVCMERRDANDCNK